MEKVYVGCLEAPAGFQPVRDPSSKWCARCKPASFKDFSDKNRRRGLRLIQD